MIKPEINTIIFDLGGVLVDWNPAYLYRKVFNGDEEKVQWFLSNVCTPEWNIEQDAGRTIAEGERIKISEFPEYEKEIRLFYKEWHQMFKGPIVENVALFQHFKQSEKYKVYALTNWSAEKWGKALELFPFFTEFDGVVVSGFEKTRKPFEKIYKILLNKYSISPDKAIFIDDNFENVQGAHKLGISTIHFTPNNLLVNQLLLNNIEI